MNSRQKGKRGERAFRDVLRMEGFKAIRGQQNRGGPDAPDVICPALPVHWEVKFGNSHSLYESFRQATKQCGTDIPVVASKRDRSEWMCYLRAIDLLAILRHSDMVRNYNFGRGSDECGSDPVPGWSVQKHQKWLDQKPCGSEQKQ